MQQPSSNDGKEQKLFDQLKEKDKELKHMKQFKVELDQEKIHQDKLLEDWENKEIALTAKVDALSKENVEFKSKNEDLDKKLNSNTN